MSYGREKNDGVIFGGDNGFTEWGNPVGSKSQAGKSFTPKRPAKTARLLDNDTDLFAEDGEKDRYLITYSDLITLLLGLFIILYTISNIDSKKYQDIINAFDTTFGSDQKVINVNTMSSSEPSVPTVQLKDKLSGLVKEQGYDDFIQLEENERGITIHILDQILFTSGSAKLETKSFEILNKISALIKKLPNDFRIEGHTDNIPINSYEFPSNWHLSVARALSTAYYLIDAAKLPQDKLTVVGYSEYKPIDSNKTSEGRAKNRRVDIVIIK